MKKIKKLIKKLNNGGSSVIMVIVALGFIGVMVGCLLMAAGYTYRHKLKDLNARDNFYYVEQAMNEIYAGIGSKTVADMQEAYNYTLEHMVRYDLDVQGYVTMDPGDANKMFKDKFMELLESNTAFSSVTNLGNTLPTYITNSSVKLDTAKLDIKKDYESGKLVKLSIKNITLTREQEYENAGGGSYIQTISTDIEIVRPDFNVAFNATGNDISNLFKYSMIADMGIEIHQAAGSPFTIAGNIYAANDYYNKKYNESTYDENVSDSDKNLTASDSRAVVKNEDGTKSPIKYNHGSVTSREYKEAGALNTYYNGNLDIPVEDATKPYDYFNGENLRSMYSGFYVDGSSVTILADTVIVPGTIAVMNKGNLTVFGKEGKKTSGSEVWTDNIVLGGYSTKKTVVDSQTNEEVEKYTGASAFFRGNLFVKDDTELNAIASKFRLMGSYYGYGDSTDKDAREFVPSVNKENFQITDAGGDVHNRGHYNSSAIIVNGEKSTLDLASADTIYLAGRSYIELSKDFRDPEEDTITISETEGSGEGATTTEQDVVRGTYEFSPKGNNFMTSDPNDTVFLRDYKTGESISIKSNQVAYIPIMYTGMPEPVYENGSFAGYWEAELHTGLKDSDLFEKYFPGDIFDDQIPCIMQEVSGKKYYYYDFSRAYDAMLAGLKGNNLNEFKDTYKSAQYYATDFIKDYVAELNNEDSTIRGFLTDITAYEDFDLENTLVTLPDETKDASIYSSGAITTKSNTKFDMITHNGTSDLEKLLSSDEYSSYNNNTVAVTSMEEGVITRALKMSNDFEREYSYIKWNLGHFDSLTDPQCIYAGELIDDNDFGDSSITPINRYLNYNVINEGFSLSSVGADKEDGSNNNGIIKLQSGYSVWVSNDDVTIKDTDGDGTVRGIVITKGDVYFDASADNGVKNFEGLIVAGGKVFINQTNSIVNIVSSSEICRTVIKECQLLGDADEDAKKFLSLFKGYENSSIEGAGVATSTDVTIDRIDYSNVVSFSNWMKNVE